MTSLMRLPWATSRGGHGRRRPAGRFGSGGMGASLCSGAAATATAVQQASIARPTGSSPESITLSETAGDSVLPAATVAPRSTSISAPLGFIDSYHLAGYGGFHVDGFALRAGAAYTWHDVGTSRGIAFRQFRDSASATSGARTAQLFGEAGYALTFARGALEPFAAFAHVNLETARIVERGGAASLTRLEGRDSVDYSTLGLRAAALLLATDATSLTARGALGWRHAFGDARPSRRRVSRTAARCHLPSRACPRAG